MKQKEIQAIKEVIEEAYIEGIHKTQNMETIRSGFHPEFRMLVLSDNKMIKISLDEWMPRIEEMKKANPQMWAGETTYKWHLVDCCNTAAVIKIEVHKNGQYFSIDYMLLYKFSEGWKIVSKVFTV
jgi:hypothetical protein